MWTIKNLSYLALGLLSLFLIIVFGIKIDNVKTKNLLISHDSSQLISSISLNKYMKRKLKFEFNENNYSFWLNSLFLYQNNQYVYDIDILDYNDLEGQYQVNVNFGKESLFNVIFYN
jgi:hypothetical protein